MMRNVPSVITRDIETDIASVRGEPALTDSIDTSFFFQDDLVKRVFNGWRIFSLFHILLKTRINITF